MGKKAPTEAPTDVNSKPAIVKKSRTSTAITAFSRRGGAEAKKLAKDTYDKKMAANPVPEDDPNWPENCVKDDTWCSWLPEGWTPALKKTNGDLLLRCYIGPAPERKRFFHKVDVEKYVGKKLPCRDRRERPLMVPEKLPKGIAAESFIERTDKSAHVPYITQRCNAAHGMQVKDVLTTLKFTDTKGKVRCYGVGDLVYDIKGGRLKVVAEKPQGPSPELKAPVKVKSKTTTPKPAKKLTKRLTPLAKSANRRKKSQEQATTPVAASSATQSESTPTTPSEIPQDITKSPVAPLRKRPAPMTPPKVEQSSTKRSRRVLKVEADTTIQKKSGEQVSVPLNRQVAVPGTPVPQLQNASLEILQDIAANVVTPLKERGVRTLKDEKNLYMLLGVGKSHNLDPVMLAAVEPVLRKPPALRGPLGDAVLQKLDEELALRIGLRA